MFSCLTTLLLLELTFTFLKEAEVSDSSVNNLDKSENLDKWIVVENRVNKIPRKE